MKAQMKVADRSGARLALLVGDDELEAGTVTLRDLRSGEGQTALPRPEVAIEVAQRLAKGGKR
jgi:histidyl-tRNA synthetase